MRTFFRGFALGAALLSTCAFAQATRTWVSGVGDDAAPCSRSAPCRTFAGAYAVTATGGEIDALDPGAFGSLTITHAITLNGLRAGRILAGSGINGITVNAPGAAVILRNLSLAGIGGKVGIRVTAVGALHLEDVSIAGFTQGISFAPDAGGKLFLRRVSVRNSGAEGLSVASASGTAAAVVTGSTFHQNAVGVAAGPGAKVTLYGGAVSANADAGVSVSAGDTGLAELNVEGTSLTGNGVGVASSAVGGTATARLSKAFLAETAQATTALTGEGSVLSFGNNRILGGSQPGCAPGTLEVGPTSLAPVTVNSAMTATPFTAFGALGTPGFVQTGALPAGVTFSHGQLSGTPTHAGLYPITVASTDGNGCTGSASLTLEVDCAGALAIAPATLPSGTTGTAFASQTFTLTGGSGTPAWSLEGTLPIGLTFSDDTLSGTPTEPGHFDLTVRAQDGAGCPASQTYGLDIAAAPGFQATTLALAAAPAPSSFGASVTLTATLTFASGTPTGTVTFFDGASSLGSAPVSGGKATLDTAALTLGAHTLTAVYGGDATYGGSRASAVQETVNKADTAVALTAAAGTNGKTTLFAKVTSSGGTPDGSVTFSQGATQLGTVALSAGTASLSVTLSPGSYTFNASYAGAANFNSSASVAVPFTVASAADAGTTPPPGQPTPKNGGCGCNQTGGGYPFALAMLALWAFTRRRRITG